MSSATGAPRSPRAVRIFEVGPRDGLQNESALLTVSQKIELVQRLAAAGLPSIEIGSFVHPRWVPQMAETDQVASGLGAIDGVELWGLVPNFRGYELAIESGLRRIAVVMSASEAHNRKNLNRGRDESLAEIERVAAGAASRGDSLRAYISTAFGCPYEGAVDPREVLRLAERLIALGATEISLGDTIGIASPNQTRDLTRRALDRLGAERVALHLHDTRGLALTNAFVAVAEGVRTLDSAVGGLGGCPYAPGAAGNLGTEDLVHMLHASGIETGVDLDAVLATTRWIEHELGLDPTSKYYRYTTKAAAPAREPAAGR